MFDAKTIIAALTSSDLDALREAYIAGNLTNVKWSRITRKLPSLSPEAIYCLLTDTSRPLCSTCSTQPVSSFISIQRGYGKYCSKSCAKKDPEVEKKKQITLAANPLWKKEAAAKAKITNLNKYGTEAPLLNADVLNKRRQTMRIIWPEA